MAAIIGIVVLALSAALLAPPLTPQKEAEIRKNTKKWESRAIPVIVILFLALFGDSLFDKIAEILK